MNKFFGLEGNFKKIMKFEIIPLKSNFSMQNNLLSLFYQINKADIKMKSLMAKGISKFLIELIHQMLELETLTAFMKIVQLLQFKKKASEKRMYYLMRFINQNMRKTRLRSITKKNKSFYKIIIYLNLI